MSTFRERLGKTTTRREPQLNSLDERTRNRIWNILNGLLPTDMTYVYQCDFWFHWYHQVKKDRVPESFSSDHHLFIGGNVRTEWEWDEVLELVECFAPYVRNYDYFSEVGRVLEEELVGWKFVEGQLVPITGECEVAAISETFDNPKVSNAAKEHLKQALAQLGPGHVVDPRAVIREAISAVEAQARKTSKDPKATLGEALKRIDEVRPLNPAFKEALSKLYGYTSDEPGIRHAADEKESRTSVDDARFFVVACSAFINWLIATSA